MTAVLKSFLTCSSPWTRAPGRPKLLRLLFTPCHQRAHMRWGYAGYRAWISRSAVQPATSKPPRRAMIFWKSVIHRTCTSIGGFRIFWKGFVSSYDYFCHIKKSKPDGRKLSAFEIFPKIWDWRLKNHDDFRHFYVSITVCVYVKQIFTICPLNYLPKSPPRSPRLRSSSCHTCLPMHLQLYSLALLIYIHVLRTNVRHLGERQRTLAKKMSIGYISY